MSIVMLMNEAGEAVGWLWPPLEPENEIDALASKIKFGHEPGMMRDLRRVSMDDAAGDLSEWAGDFDAWEDELAGLAS